MTTESTLHDETEPASAPTLQEALDQSGSAVNLLWKAGVAPWQPPSVPDEFTGWSEEQAASEKTVALSEQSHHMLDLFIEGPDATRLLAETSPNNYEKFDIGQAKQYIAITPQGLMIGDAILLREAERKYTLTGPPGAADWVSYQAELGNYDVELRADPSSDFRGGKDPMLFRYEIQGPRALELIERVLGAPIPDTKFFHSVPVSLDGRHFRALRHGMTGQPGYEFVGDYKDGPYVLDRFLKEGESFGLVRVGGKAYASNSVESGWLPNPLPGIYTDPALEAYRRSLSLFSFEGQYPLHGSFFSEDIEDYYSSPYEIGYGRLFNFNHDFIGREALERDRDAVARQKVTLVLDPEDVRRVFGQDIGYVCSFGQCRVEADSELVGVAYPTTHVSQRERILSLALVENKYAEPGTEVTFVWGEHPGPGTDPDADLGFERIKATVAPVPYNEFARKQYRQN